MQRLAKTFVKFCAAGVGNTILGYTVIFLLMGLSVGPKVANVCGYAVGLVLSFVFSKRWVFSSTGDGRTEAVRFLLAFPIAYLANYLVLLYLLHNNILEVHIAQLTAGVAYISTYFLLSNFFVFSGGERNLDTGCDNES